MIKSYQARKIRLGVVIRSVGERTEHACRVLVEQQIDAKNVHLLSVSPFREALRQSYQTGLENNYDWTMVIDADVLLASGVIDKIRKHILGVDQSVFVLQTEMLDKFFGGDRVGGVKVYRTSMLQEALQHIPESSNRPEAHVIKAMHKSGSYVEFLDLVCGLHDYEQFNDDVFRKGYAHGVKSKSFAEVLIPYWERMAEVDSDFQLLLAGYLTARKHKGELKLQKDEVEGLFREYSIEQNLPSKPPLGDQFEDPQYIDELIVQQDIPEEYYKAINMINAMGRPTRPE